MSVIRLAYLYYDLFTLKKFYNFFFRFTAKIKQSEDFISFVNFMNKQNNIESIHVEDEETNNGNGDNSNNINSGNPDSNKQINKNFGNSSSFVTKNYAEIKLLNLLNSSKKYFSKNKIFIFYDYNSWLTLFNKYLSNKNINNSNGTSSDSSINNVEKESLNDIDFDSIQKAIADKITIWAYLEGIVDDNFQQLYKEMLFYPFLIIAFLTNPIVFYLGFLALKTNEHNIFRQRKFEVKLMIFFFIWYEYLKILLNIFKILMILTTIVKIPVLIELLYYYSRTLFSKNPDCYYKFLLDENYEGEFSKDLNTLVLQALNFYFISALILLNFLLILRIPSLCRRVGRFVKAYISNLQFKYFGVRVSKQEKASPLEATKISFFTNVSCFNIQST